jgi:hypothetical protein
MRQRMSALLPVGVLLMVLGAGNWYTGISKGAEHEALLAAGNIPTTAASFDEFPELSARTTATLLQRLQRGSDQETLISTKLDFYRVVLTGGRMLTILGLFCSLAGLIRTWYQQRLDGEIAPQ